MRTPILLLPGTTKIFAEDFHYVQKVALSINNKNMSHFFQIPPMSLPTGKKPLKSVPTLPLFMVYECGVTTQHKNIKQVNKQTRKYIGK